MHWIYYVGRCLTIVLLFIFFRWRVNGKENIPRQGPLLIVANHLNLADPPILAASIDRKAVFMAKEELFRSRLSRYFVQNSGAFPVRRGRLTRKVLGEAERWLEQGVAVIMFPEGSRSKTGQLQPAFSGSALIASRFGATILPVGIAGTESIKGKAWWLRRPDITVNIGRPFSPPASGKLTKTELAQLTDSIMGRIAELLPPGYRGDYAGET
ncbi:lysophospholipid acyltransferase family protein [Chloroflexota bacterium]